MRYTEFARRVESSLLAEEVVSQEVCFGLLVQQTPTGVLVDRRPTQFTSLEEAKDNIRQQKIQQELQEEIQQEQYAEISSNVVADIIKQHHDGIRVTDTLVESYVELASSRLFTTDPVVLSIRKLNKLDRLFETHMDFDLEDGSVVVITEHVHQKINNIFSKHPDVVDFMKTNKENFLYVLDQLEG